MGEARCVGRGVVLRPAHNTVNAVGAGAMLLVSGLAEGWGLDSKVSCVIQMRSFPWECGSQRSQRLRPVATVENHLRAQMKLGSRASGLPRVNQTPVPS
jgi:hypothetical protein